MKVTFLSFSIPIEWARDSKCDILVFFPFGQNFFEPRFEFEKKLILNFFVSEISFCIFAPVSEWRNIFDVGSNSE